MLDNSAQRIYTPFAEPNQLKRNKKNGSITIPAVAPLRASVRRIDRKRHVSFEYLRTAFHVLNSLLLRRMRLEQSVLPTARRTVSTF